MQRACGWFWLLGLFAVSPGYGAGAWHASNGGFAISQKGVIKDSARLSMPSTLKLTGVVTLIRWHYQFLLPPHDEVIVRLCSQQRCIVLPEMMGETLLFNQMPVSEPYYFRYHVVGQGALFPHLYLLTNEIMVHYQ